MIAEGRTIDYRHRKDGIEVLTLNLRQFFKLIGFRKIGIFFLLSGLNSLVELAGLGALLVFVRILSSPEEVLGHPRFSAVFSFLDLQTPRKVILATGLVIIVLQVARVAVGGAYRFFMAYFSHQIRHLLTLQIFRRYFARTYDFFSGRDIGELFRNVENLTAGASTFRIMPILSIVSEFITVLGVLALLLVNDPKLGLTLLGFLAITTLAIFSTVKGLLARLGERRTQTYSRLISTYLQVFGAMREIMAYNRESHYLGVIQQTSKANVDSEVKLGAIAGMPPLLIETVSVAAIVGFSMVLITLDYHETELFAFLVLFALAAYRLLPSMNRLMLAFSALKTGKYPMELLRKELEANGGKSFEESANLSAQLPQGWSSDLSLRDIAFKYEGREEPTLNEVDFVIQRGETVAVVGQSGSGKTTLINLLLGLSTIQKGEITLDSRRVLPSEMRQLRRLLGYVPQDVFLLNSSLLDNIVLGERDEEIDRTRLKEALRMARLEAFVESLPMGLLTEVGERGTLISGGQRQRVGIARALYRNPEILVLDEPTASLDQKTEHEFMDILLQLKEKKSIILITHKLDSAKKCDRIYHVGGGKVRQVDAENKQLALFAAAPA